MKKNRIIFFMVAAIILILYCVTDMTYPVYALWVMLVYLVIARVITILPGKKISYVFSKGSEGKAGEKTETELHIHNGGYVPVLCGKVKVEAENLLTEETVSVEREMFLMPGADRNIKFSFSDPCCGCIRIKIKEISCADPLGIFRTVRNDFMQAETSHVLMPEIRDLDINKERLDIYDMESYRYSQVKSGDDPSETFGIREYREGDSIKSIHWKLSGKTGETVIREYGLPIDNRVFVICDKQRFREAETVSEIKEVTELYCSLLYTLEKNRIKFSTGWFDYNKNEFIQKEINNTDDVYDIIPEILSSPFRKDSISATEHFLEADVDEKYGLFIYVTSEGEITERLREYGEVNIYRPENFK